MIFIVSYTDQDLTVLRTAEIYHKKVTFMYAQLQDI